MWPLFRQGDCIFFKEVPAGKLRKGDVIVFSVKHSVEIVHRIIDIHDSSFTARGDNNPPGIVEEVPFGSVFGRVVFYERASKRRPVAGGPPGLFRAKLFAANGLLRRSFRLSYSAFCKLGIVRLFWRPEISTMLLATDGGSAVRLFCSGRSIGKYYINTDVLVLRKPYDLVVRKAHLNLPIQEGNRLE